MTRGLVLGLTAVQRRVRMLYLAGEAPLGVVAGTIAGPPRAAELCPDIFYLLKEHNGGKDPTATDPADRWSTPAELQRVRLDEEDRRTLGLQAKPIRPAFVNRTADCIGGAAWCGGWDRLQPVRFAHIYNGWINTDSMRLDAGGPAKCFARLKRPEPGCYVVFASGVGGHTVGHIGGVVDVPAEWDPLERDCWDHLGGVDVAARIGRANKRTTGRTWFGKDAWFVVPTMTP